MLNDLEQAVLDFERLRWKFPGARESAIRQRFGWSPTRHGQVLNRLVDDPAALAYDPQLVNRLRRLRDARRAARAARRAS